MSSWRDHIASIRSHFNPSEVSIASAEEDRAIDAEGPSCYSHRAVAFQFQVQVRGQSVNAASAALVMDATPTIPVAVPSERTTEVIHDIAADFYEYLRLQAQLKRLTGDGNEL